jgi:hypothetical protein
MKAGYNFKEPEDRAFSMSPNVALASIMMSLAMS